MISTYKRLGRECAADVCFSTIPNESSMLLRSQRISKAFQNRLLTLLYIWKRCVGDINRYVRHSAAFEIFKVMEKFPEMQSDAFELFSTLSRDHDFNVRNAAASEISKGIVRFPEKASEALALLSTLCQNTHKSVRNSLVSGFSKFIESFPKKPSDVFEVL